MTHEAPLAPRYLSLAQAGTVTGLSTRTLRRAIKDARLRAHHVGRLVRIELDELQRWIESDGKAVSAAAAPAHVVRGHQQSARQSGRR
jgi:excisionase family DNA binding protein